MIELNKNQDLRDQIIFKDKSPNYMGGVASFERLCIWDLEELIKNNFVDLDDSQNNSPTAKEFYNFVKNNGFSGDFHGYVVEKNRSDYRVTIEGIEINSEIEKDTLIQFANLCRHADEFICTSTNLYCWYD